MCGHAFSLFVEKPEIGIFRENVLIFRFQWIYVRKLHLVSQTTSVPKASVDIGTSGCAVWHRKLEGDLFFLPDVQRGRIFEAKGLEVCRSSLGSAQLEQSPGKEGLQWEEWGAEGKEQLPCINLAIMFPMERGASGGGLSRGGA